LKVKLTGFSFDDKTLSHTSKRELLIKKYIESLGITCIHSSKADNPSDYELDLYCPELNCAFEYNGFMFHHSDTSAETFSNSKPKNYHKDKSENCLSHGIKLYHLWEHLSDDFIKNFINYIFKLDDGNFKPASLLNSIFVNNKSEKVLCLDRDYFPSPEEVKYFLDKIAFHSQFLKLEPPARIWFFTKSVTLKNKKYGFGEILSDYAYKKLDTPTEGYGLVPIYNSGIWHLR
jgi:hypothetical protein